MGNCVLYYTKLDYDSVLDYVLDRFLVTMGRFIKVEMLVMEGFWVKVGYCCFGC